ncbi:MAG: hypothetical protein IPJ77_22435 [Planctomycetes bacterium]|nr:hypothetical protein [Planctomycetota bacterium]
MRPIALLLVGLALAACSNSDPKALTDEGSRKLGAGDAKAALESFDEALARMTPESAEFVRASMGRFQALARLEPARTKNEFLAFQAARPTAVKDMDFKLVVDELVKRGNFEPATDLVAAGQKAFPESQLIQQLLKSVGDAAKASKDPEAMKKLKGMGYVGDDG